MLKRLFTSNTRIKLLTVFLMNMEEEFFIRELTRKLDEQINSIRRELDNLKKLGFLRSKTKNRKKYYYINNDFIFLEELKSIILKTHSSLQTIASDLEKMGNIKLLAFLGVFADQPTTTVDMLIVGDIDKVQLARYLTNDVKTKRPVKYATMNEKDYLYRTECKDKFVTDIINSEHTHIHINKIKNT